jgi:hypothetical protein
MPIPSLTDFDGFGSSYSESDLRLAIAIAVAGSILGGGGGGGGGGITQAQVKAAIESATNLDGIEGSLGGINGLTEGISDNLGLTTDTPPSTGTGTGSLIGLIKFLNSIIESVQSPANVLPDSSDPALVASLRDPIFLPTKQTITGFLSVTATNLNLLDGTGGGAATDVRNYQSGKLTVVSTATTGSYTVQGAVDLNFTIGVHTIQLFESTNQSLNPVNAAITPTNTTRTFDLNLQGINFIRVNLTTATPSVRPHLVVNQASFVPLQTNVQQASGANLNTNVVGLPTLATVTTVTSVTAVAAITNLGISTFALTSFRNIALTSTAVSVKGSPGRVHGINVINPNASPVYLKIYNALVGSVTVGVTIPFKVLFVPASSSLVLPAQLLAIVNCTAAIVIAAVTGVADSSNTAPGTALHVEIEFV